jgi:AcrR family transcriptional regulator
VSTVRPTSTREIARSAVRIQLAQAAFALIAREGFNNVTVNDLAAETGVSRSTFLRYFNGKEDAVLSAFDAHGEQLAQALRDRPADEEDWTALRRAMDTVIDRYRQDPVSALAVTRLVQDTPALRARQLARRHSWLPGVTHALAERAGRTGLVPVAVAVKSAAALECLHVAIGYWTGSDGRLSLADLLDEAFAALANG